LRALTLLDWRKMTTIEVAPIKPAVPFDVLDSLDIRVGTIEAVEDVPK
jgi:hypothetical protein